jgi:hypothetical protein
MNMFFGIPIPINEKTEVIIIGLEACVKVENSGYQRNK